MSKHSTGAGFVKGERNGNVISPKGSNNGSSGTVTEELSEGEIRQKRVLGDKNDLVVDELSKGGKVREREEGERYIKIPVDNMAQQDRLEKWGFDSEELSAMREGKHLIEGTEPVDHDKTWREALKEEVEAKNRELAKQKKQEEIEAARKEMRKYTKYDTPVNELQGSEFLEILQESQGEGSTDPEGFEEVKQKIEEKYEPMINGGSEPEINNPDLEGEELAELGEAWGEYGGVFAEFAEDIEDSDSDTEFVTLSEGKAKRKVKTTDNELRAAILNHEEEPFEGSVEIHEYDQSTGTVTATISKEN